MGGVRQRFRKIFHRGPSDGSRDVVPESTHIGASAAARTASFPQDAPQLQTPDFGNQPRFQLVRDASPPSAISAQHEQYRTRAPVDADADNAADRLARLKLGSQGESRNVTASETDRQLTDEELRIAQEAGVTPGYSEDTTVHERVAEPVVHETVRHDVHEIREEQIERESHEYHEIRHIQPVIQTEVLPARHFVPTEEGGLREITDEIRAQEQSGVQHHVPSAVGTAL